MQAAGKPLAGPGRIHLYTGAGKGKTTAALGLAVRAAGAGLKVCIIQFLKGGHYSEHDALARLEEITLKRYGQDHWVKGQPQPGDYQSAAEAFAALREVIQEGRHQLVIADELLVAVDLTLIREIEVLDLMTQKPHGLELVLTGRGATAAMIGRADLVTEMKEIKHYYQQGSAAVRGIEF